jgi:Viral BACON domain
MTMKRKNCTENTKKIWLLYLLAIAWVGLCFEPSVGLVAAVDNPDPPASPVKLIFIHHSTGGNWLADPNGDGPYGGLGNAMMNNNYFVSATNYGWGPNGIGDRTDIVNWPEWFTGPDRDAITTAVYMETGQSFLGYGPWSRLAVDPGGQNEIIMFKSCFPNSNLYGSPLDSPLAEPNDWECSVANAKAVYNNLLTYFTSRQDKLFIIITAPPLSINNYPDDPDLSPAARAANARAFNNWLVFDWLSGYAHKNVAVFDYYNVLTSNGGTVDINDADQSGGNHHRWWNGAIQHIQGLNSNFAAYPSGDSHPSTAGHQKATSEFVSLLNIYYHRWRSGVETPVLSVTPASRNVAKDAGATTFNVSNTGTGIMPWTAAVTSGSSWLSIYSGTSGTDVGTITCSFTANTSTSSRTATIRVTAHGAAGSPVDVTATQTVTSAPTLLWAGNDGRASIWTMDVDANKTIETFYGSYADWTPKSYHRNSDGTGNMLWGRVDGYMSLWMMDASGNPASMSYYGPYADWTASGYHRNSDGTGNMLWVRTDGYTSLWNMDVSGDPISKMKYGPYEGWTAMCYHGNSDGTANMLWVRTDGYVSLWTVDASGNPISKMKYGPYEGWTAKSYYRNSDGTGRMLWVRTDGYVSLWNMDVSGNPISKMKYGPYEGWSAQDFD